MAYNRTRINGQMAVWEVLRELMYRVCDSSDAGCVIPENFATDKLEMGIENAARVQGARCVRAIGPSVNLFYCYRRQIGPEDPIRQQDVYKRKRYTFENNVYFSCPALIQDEDQVFYLLRNFGWASFEPFINYFHGYLGNDEVQVIKANINNNPDNNPVPGEEGGEDAKRQNEEDDMNDTVICPRNRLVFGAPGTGKSHRLEEERKKDSDFKTNYERVTFYPTYSYAQFVGTYKPVMKKPEGKNEEEIAYEFVPGPFLRVLVKALNEVPDANGKKTDWCLIIEEINRANAAAVFGDVFQLLDRGSNGESEYAIAASEDVKNYLKKNLTDTGKQALNALAGSTDKLKIPANMYLWATMNSADQGVTPLDTAFKRRWEFEYIGVDDEAKGDCRGWTIEGHNYNWNDLRQFINGALSAFGVNEDKLMGPYFVKPQQGSQAISEKSFGSKVLMYLWEDAGRMIRTKLFGDGIKTYSQLLEAWKKENGGIKVFKDLATGDKLDKATKDFYSHLTDPVQGS